MSMHHNSESRWGRSSSPVLEQSIKKLARKPYLVHRLDHRTSGACILGFDSTTTSKLHGRLRSKDAMKLYVALVRGDLRDKFIHASECANDNGVDMSIDGNGSIIGRCERLPIITSNDGHSIEMNTEEEDITGSEYNGKITVNIPIKVDNVEKEASTVEKEALTDFYFLSSMDIEEEEVNNDDDENTTTIPYITKSLTLLLCRPRSGRTHQIRKHVRKAFNAPIIGDSEHGDSRVNRFWRQNIDLDRLGLHCWYINLPPSNDNSEIECMAPLPLDFSEALHHELLQPLWKEATRIQPQLKREPYDERGGSYGRSYSHRKASK
jgi:23S rRNA-/tRNA-specific pseudouridylate synthase